MKIRNLRWWIAGLLMLATIVNYIDRNALGIAADTIQKQYGIDDQGYSYIVMCFTIAYMIMQPIAGRLIDWMGTRMGFMIAIIWWSVANMGTALARGAVSLGFFRALLGVGEAGNFPAANKTISEWFPPKERTMATGVFNVGSGVGAMIAPPLIAWLILQWGWQAAFVLPGAVGFLWVILWYFLYQSPEKHPNITPEELKLITESQEKRDDEDRQAQERGVWGFVLRQRDFWGLAILRFLAEPAWGFFVFWLPKYLITERGFDLKAVAVAAWIPFLAADLGSLAGGFYSPFFIKRGFSVIRARKAAATLSACMMPFVLLASYASTAGWALFFFSIGTFAHNSLSATTLTLPADLFPKRAVASANGLAGGIGYLGSTLFMALIGWILTHYHVYRPVFWTVAFLDIVGVMFLWSLVGEGGKANGSGKSEVLTLDE
jgi:ACS family hexuronate transporter-like MFS transporter